MDWFYNFPHMNDETLRNLRRAIDEGFRLRFIEQMPLDAGGIWNRASMVTADDIFAQLDPLFHLTPVPGRGSAPSSASSTSGCPAGRFAVGGLMTNSKPSRAGERPVSSAAREAEQIGAAA